MNSASFLQSDMWCKWAKGSKLAKQAGALAGKTDADTIWAVYWFVLKNLKYDREKARRLKGGRGYVPNPEKTFESMRGICFDAASLMCAMLRSQGIPAKLCVGYRNGQTHAWVMVKMASAWRMFDPTFGPSDGYDRYRTVYEL